jgi:N-methylhydantoinase A/oxoprolinase/acetone carboxylase beta subunit
LNAAILPRMIRTARMTAEAVERAAIPAPLMVMRSDGGVMDVREIERRPILTLLSGPAAGVAGALLYERLSDGVFVEVGGTSSDCSAIRMGRPQMRPARIGGHRTMLRTLDVRTLGIGGGSMLRLDGNRIVDVGPRSAHIAGCRYASFVTTEELEGARFERIAPAAHDRAEYASFVTRDRQRIALTTTCAANFLGIVPPGAFARGNADAVRVAFELLARELGEDAVVLARSTMSMSAAKIREAVQRLATDYELDPARLTIVGGGGGAGALVPAAAEAMGCSYRIAADAHVIAPIGVALALVRDVVERTIYAPTPQEIASIRREAVDRVIAAGASPDRIEVDVDIDSQRNRVRAAAYGATAMTDSSSMSASSERERRAAAAQSLDCDPLALEEMTLTAALHGYQRTQTLVASFGRTRNISDLCVVDERGILRLALRDSRLVRATVGEAGARVAEEIERATQFGDVGRALPALYLLRGARIAAYEGLTSADQAAALALEETSGCDPGEPIALLLVTRNA